MNIQKVNLNLLVHFNTLLNERSVSKAAEKSFISQTAMSHILKQLRELFHDELFIRKPHGLQPTQYALDLSPKITKFLNCFDDIFQEQVFDHMTEEVNFKLVINSHGEHIVIPNLCAYLDENVSRYHIQTFPLSSQFSLEKMMEIDIDLVIAPGFVEVGKNVCHETLFEEEAVCIMNKSSPLASQKLTSKEFLEAGQVDIKVSSMDSGNILYQSIEELQQRDIKITVHDIVHALEIVQRTSLITTAPRKLVELMQNKYDLVIKPFPFPNNQYKINLYYHKRLENSKPLQWLTSAIHEHGCKKSGFMKKG